MTILLLSTLFIPAFLLQQETETNFNDLGKLLLGGVGVAIVFAIGFTVLRMRLRDKNPQSSGFVSIGSIHNDKDD